MPEHRYFMDLALEEARKALEANEVAVGCVAVQNGTVIQKEHNRTNQRSDPLAHAEFIALQNIISAGHTALETLTFYITVEPCVMCNGILKRAGIEVFFGCYNEIFGTQKLTDEVAGVCLRDDRCIAVLKEFYNRENLLAPEDKRLSKANRT